jgi:hypothetical protein
VYAGSSSSNTRREGGDKHQKIAAKGRRQDHQMGTRRQSKTGARGRSGGPDLLYRGAELAQPPSFYLSLLSPHVIQPPHHHHPLSLFLPLAHVAPLNARRTRPKHQGKCLLPVPRRQMDCKATRCKI